MTLNQLLGINISLYSVQYERPICARIPDISPDIRYEKTPSYTISISDRTLI